MKYTVIVKIAGIVNSATPNLGRKAAEKLARDEKERSNGKVFITWFRASDQQHGYLNPDGNHAITGKAW